MLEGPPQNPSWPLHNNSPGFGRNGHFFWYFNRLIRDDLPHAEKKIHVRFSGL